MLHGRGCGDVRDWLDSAFTRTAAARSADGRCGRRWIGSNGSDFSWAATCRFRSLRKRDLKCLNQTQRPPQRHGESDKLYPHCGLQCKRTTTWHSGCGAAAVVKYHGTMVSVAQLLSLACFLLAERRAALKDGRRSEHSHFCISICIASFISWAANATNGTGTGAILMMHTAKSATARRTS